MLLALINLASLVLAQNKIQKMSDYRNTDRFFYSNNRANVINSTSDTDVIFKSNFEPIPLLSMSASPENINSGDSSTISWILSNNTDSCLKTGDWSGTFVGSDVTNGMHSLELSNITAHSTFELQCTNSSGDSQIRSASIV